MPGMIQKSGRSSDASGYPRKVLELTPLPSIVTDPAGDAGAADLVEFLGQYDSSLTTLRWRFSSSDQLSGIYIYMLLDLDENQSTYSLTTNNFRYDAEFLYTNGKVHVTNILPSHYTTFLAVVEDEYITFRFSDDAIQDDGHFTYVIKVYDAVSNVSDTAPTRNAE